MLGERLRESRMSELGAGGWCRWASPMSGSCWRRRVCEGGIGSRRRGLPGAELGWCRALGERLRAPRMSELGGWRVVSVEVPNEWYLVVEEGGGGGWGVGWVGEPNGWCLLAEEGL